MDAHCLVLLAAENRVLKYPNAKKIIQDNAW
jgi:hypothetical protein